MNDCGTVGLQPDYLQTITEVFRVRNELGVFIAFIEPGTPTDFSGSLFPVHSVALPLFDVYIITLPVNSYNHLFPVYTYSMKRKYLSQARSKRTCVYRVCAVNC